MLRWGLVERVEHFLAVIIMSTFILTGLSMFIMKALGITPPTGLHGIHMLCSGLFSGLAIFHLIYHLGLRRGKSKIWITKRDIEDMVPLIRYYLGRGELPRMSFHNPGEKILVYWIMGVTCILVMGITGYIRLWFGNPLWAKMLHDTFFFIITAILLLHFYMATLYKEHRPLLRAMFTNGKISVKYVKSNMPLWYQKIKQYDEEC